MVWMPAGLNALIFLKTFGGGWGCKTQNLPNDIRITSNLSEFYYICFPFAKSNCSFGILPTIGESQGVTQPPSHTPFCARPGVRPSYTDATFLMISNIYEKGSYIHYVTRGFADIVSTLKSDWRD